jgi:chorismate mutase/prephenate dehydratase
VFAEQKINMIKLESRPIPGEPWRYMFYIDIETDLESAALTAVRAALVEKSEYFKVLGCY